MKKKSGEPARKWNEDGMIKAVVFDLDDTLYREYDFVEQAFRRVAGVMAEYPEKERNAGTKEEPPRPQKSPEELFRRMTELMAAEGRGKIFDRLCAWYNVDIPVPELVRIYRETEPVLSLYPDGEEFLRQLKKAGIKTGLITDGNVQVQKNKIRALGLDKRLDVVLASWEIGSGKPERRVYEYCLERLGCRPPEALYIGDNPLKDFIGAKELGMKTVRIVRPEGMHMRRIAEKGCEADRTVRLLTEIKLDAW